MISASLSAAIKSCMAWGPCAGSVRSRIGKSRAAIPRRSRRGWTSGCSGFSGNEGDRWFGSPPEPRPENRWELRDALPPSDPSGAGGHVNKRRARTDVTPPVWASDTSFASPRFGQRVCAARAGVHAGAGASTTSRSKQRAGAPPSRAPERPANPRATSYKLPSATRGRAGRGAPRANRAAIPSVRRTRDRGGRLSASPDVCSVTCQSW